MSAVTVGRDWKKVKTLRFSGGNQSSLTWVTEEKTVMVRVCRVATPSTTNFILYEPGSPGTEKCRSSKRMMPLASLASETGLTIILSVLSETTVPDVKKGGTVWPARTVMMAYAYLFATGLPSASTTLSSGSVDSVSPSVTLSAGDCSMVTAATSECTEMGVVTDG